MEWFCRHSFPLLRKCSIQYDFNFLNQFCSARNSQPFTDDCSGSWPHSHVSSVTLFLKQSHLAAFGGNSICHVHYCMVFKAKKHCYLTIFVVVLGVIKNWVLYYTLMKVHNSSMYCTVYYVIIVCRFLPQTIPKPYKDWMRKY